MSDLIASLSLILGIVVFCELARMSARYLLSNRNRSVHALELISTFQLCACTHELKVQAEVGGLEARVALTCTFVISVVHAVSFHGAFCNPTGVLEHLCRGTLTPRDALARVSCQLCAAVLARWAMPHAWALSLCALHQRHGLTGFTCTSSPINGPLLLAAGTELACGFIMHTAVSNMKIVHRMCRVPAISALITTLVYAGGPITGAVFNPALAFSIQFPCPGYTFKEYCFVYWLAPILGMIFSLLLCEKVMPGFSGRSTVSNDNGLKKRK